jgi:hypothetical protein
MALREPPVRGRVLAWLRSIRWDSWIEMVAVLPLATAAWSGDQAALWSGTQATRFSQATAVRVQATNASSQTGCAGPAGDRRTR